MLICHQPPELLCGQISPDLPAPCSSTPPDACLHLPSSPASAPCSGSFYPGTGAAHEVGEGAGEGYSVNVPWPCGGMRNGDYLAAFHHVLLPIAYGGTAGARWLERQHGQREG